jgi:hypothetical protein
MTPTPSPTPALFTLDGVPLFTQAGGVFFLIPALRALGHFDSLPEPANPWSLLECAGKVLLASRYPGFVFDDLWPALRDLAGLDPAQPLPPFDFPRPPRRSTLRAIAMRDFPTGWRRLLGSIAPPLAAALTDALRTRDLATALLLRRAAIHITRTHVDVVFQLRDATGAVRRAGLDLNPGWVPQLGRIVTFHYRQEVRA